MDNRISPRTDRRATRGSAHTVEERMRAFREEVAKLGLVVTTLVMETPRGKLVNLNVVELGEKAVA